MNDILNKFVAEQSAVLDQKVRSAFREHFGFPIDEVEDTENLEHCTVEGNPTEFFRYRGQTFLLYERGALKVKMEHDEMTNSYTGIVEHKFLEV